MQAFTVQTFTVIARGDHGEAIDGAGKRSGLQSVFKRGGSRFALRKRVKLII